jgi:hypothetical protein
MKADHFFSLDSPKAIKASKFGYVNAINYMAPASTAGVGNLCPHASAGCLALCLGWYSGQAGMLSNAELETGSNNVRRSRQRKAEMFMRDRKAFLEFVTKGIAAAQRKALRVGKALCVRLNGATDIVWESVAPFVFATFSTIQFVDYTKNYKRMLRFCEGKLPSNYHLTFSRSEINEAECLDVLAHGGNVAVVFAGKLPETYLGRQVINGDEHDLRHLDAKGGVVVGLSPKGRKTKNDTSGFVVRL